jgi:hypothetical protein
METQSQPYRLGEYHSFSAAGTEFLYLVPSGSIFAVEGIAKLVIELLGAGEMPRDVLVAKLLELGCSRRKWRTRSGIHRGRCSSVRPAEEPLAAPAGIPRSVLF